MTTNRIRLAAMFCLAVTTVFGPLRAADKTGDELVPMIVGLLSDNDPEMRAMGLQQVREAAKGSDATKRFAALLPKLSLDAQAGLIAALADRGDAAARPAVLSMLESRDERVRAAALGALGSLGRPDEIPRLVRAMSVAPPAEKTAARESLAWLRGPTVNAAIADELKRAKPEIRLELLDVLVTRRAADTATDMLPLVADADPIVRTAATAALGKLAGPQHVAGMLNGVLRAAPGPEREAAEKAVMFVCNRTADVNRRADPLLAAFAKLGGDDKRVLLPVLGRVGGPAALVIVESAIAQGSPRHRDAGIRALCNWPNATVAARLIDLAQTAPDAAHRALARKALIRVAPLPDRRSDAERLSLLKKAMAMSASDEERSLVLRRVRAIRTIESLRFVTPYLDTPQFAEVVCATIVELAHHRELREPNKAEFDKALDRVIHTSKDPGVVDRATRYKKGQT